jgi:hypothetical protein
VRDADRRSGFLFLDKIEIVEQVAILPQLGWGDVHEKPPLKRGFKYDQIFEWGYKYSLTKNDNNSSLFKASPTRSKASSPNPFRRRLKRGEFRSVLQVAIDRSPLKQTPIPNPSYGLPTQSTSSQLSNAGSKLRVTRWVQPVEPLD